MVDVSIGRRRSYAASKDDAYTQSTIPARAMLLWVQEGNFGMRRIRLRDGANFDGFWTGSGVAMGSRERLFAGSVAAPSVYSFG